MGVTLINQQSSKNRMMRLVVTLVACMAVVRAAPEAGAMIGCDECVHEMRKMGDIIRHHAPGIEERVRQNYCPSLGEELLQDCEEHLAHSYLAMLNMIVQHFFVDGAQHICQAWGACHPYKAVKPREFTCAECVEGMEFVEAYMRDPLWVAEYTLYLEQNFCVHDQGDMKCVDMVKTHFPPMHEIAMGAFDPQNICDADFAVCGATHPPTPPHPTRPPMF